MYFFSPAVPFAMESANKNINAKYASYVENIAFSEISVQTIFFQVFFFFLNQPM